MGREETTKPRQQVEMGDGDSGARLRNTSNIKLPCDY